MNKLILFLKDRSKKNLRNIFLFVFLLFLSFGCGNVFGLYTKTLENFYLNSFCILLLIEIISYLKYSKNFETNQQKIILQSINILKRGFLIGIFVEAFKVGS